MKRKMNIHSGRKLQILMFIHFVNDFFSLLRLLEIKYCYDIIKIIGTWTKEVETIQKNEFESS